MLNTSYFLRGEGICRIWLSPRLPSHGGRLQYLFDSVKAVGRYKTSKPLWSVQYFSCYLAFSTSPKLHWSSWRDSLPPLIFIFAKPQVVLANHPPPPFSWSWRQSRALVSRHPAREERLCDSGLSEIAEHIIRCIIFDSHLLIVHSIIFFLVASKLLAQSRAAPLTNVPRLYQNQILEPNRLSVHIMVVATIWPVYSEFDNCLVVLFCGALAKY